MHITSGHGKYFSIYQEHNWGFSIPNHICHKPCPYSIFSLQQATNKYKIMKETVKIVSYVRNMASVPSSTWETRSGLALDCSHVALCSPWWEHISVPLVGRHTTHPEMLQKQGHWEWGFAKLSTVRWIKRGEVQTALHLPRQPEMGSQDFTQHADSTAPST